MESVVAIGARLKEERKRLRLSQTDFAALGGAARPTQYNYEAGIRSPDASYLSAIASAGADVLYILTGQRQATPSALMPRNVFEEMAAQGALPGQAMAEVTLGKASAPSTQPSTDLTEREKALLDNFRHSSEEGRKAMMSTGAAFAQQVKSNKKTA